jgi:hypothetical protein
MKKNSFDGCKQQKTFMVNDCKTVPFKKNKVKVTYYTTRLIGWYFDFVPEDMMPYYDMYDNGNCIFYIKHGNEILPIYENDIKVSIKEIPKRVQCGVTA